jgi:hypothetical protein
LVFLLSRFITIQPVDWATTYICWVVLCQNLFPIISTYYQIFMKLNVLLFSLSASS